MSSTLLIPATVTSENELKQILDLQRQNLKQSLSEKEKVSEGFITMSFTLPVLKAMHQLSPSVIIKDHDRVAAYALVLLQEGRHIYPAMEPMFRNFDSLTWKNKPLNSHRFYIMGQVCISKKYRGKGLFDMLYQKHKELFHHQYDFVITEISVANHRSRRAHERTGFKSVAIHRDELDEWDVVLWDWK